MLVEICERKNKNIIIIIIIFPPHKLMQYCLIAGSS
jgi:hypothetical protein